MTTMYCTSPFADEHGKSCWTNYGGVMYVCGDDSDWVEDDMGLTKSEAKELADHLNNRPDLRVPIKDLNVDELYSTIDTWITNNITTLGG